jgi:hypothetical protein
MNEVLLPLNSYLTPPNTPSIFSLEPFSSHACASFLLYHTPAPPSSSLALALALVGYSILKAPLKKTKPE